MTASSDIMKAFEDLLAMLPPASQEAMRQLMASARERPRLGSLAQEALARLDAGDRESAVVDWVGRHLDACSDALAALQALPRGLQVYYLSFVVEAQVMNGGFNQFFWNSSARFAPLIAPALSDLGSPGAAEIFREAWAVAIAEGVERPKDCERSLEMFSASCAASRLQALDRPFCELAMHFPALREKIAATNDPAFDV